MATDIAFVAPAREMLDERGYRPRRLVPDRPKSNRCLEAEVLILVPVLEALAKNWYGQLRPFPDLPKGTYGGEANIAMLCRILDALDEECSCLRCLIAALSKCFSDSCTH